MPTHTCEYCGRIRKGVVTDNGAAMMPGECVGCGKDYGSVYYATGHCVIANGRITNETVYVYEND